MRAIKFRAYLKGVRIFEVKNIDLDNEEVLLVDEDNEDFGITPFKDIELMQFTGLYDKNGKEVFEGDLFRVKDTYHCLLKEDTFKRDTIFEVVYDKTGFVLKVVKSDTEHLGNRIGSYRIGDLVYFEEKIKHKIIGNIYENPELLEI